MTQNGFPHAARKVSECKAEKPAECRYHRAYRRLEAAEALGNPAAIRVARQVVAAMETARDPKASADVLEDLTDYPEQEVVLAVAKNPSLSCLGQNRIYRQRYAHAALVKNPNLDWRILDLLAVSEDKKVLAGVVAHPNVAAESLRYIATHCSDKKLASVAATTAMFR